MEKPSKETKENWLRDNKYWKWGVFYYNSEDKRIFPPKRNPWMGWTVNFANIRSVIVMILFITISTAISLYFSLNSK
jgi:uncharacterized membrane protein